MITDIRGSFSVNIEWLGAELLDYQKGRVVFKHFINCLQDTVLGRWDENSVKLDELAARLMSKYNECVELHPVNPRIFTQRLFCCTEQCK